MSAAAPVAPVEIELPGLSAEQMAFLEADDRCLDFEGAIRSGKSTVGILKLWVYAFRYPGIGMLAARWKEGDVNEQLKPLFRDVMAWFPAWMHPTWNADERRYEWANGSYCYLIHLKSSEDTARYSALRGKTLAIVLFEQPEEIPEDIYVEAKGRLSQPGMPKQIILIPNPVDEDHWIADHFPSDGDKPGHRYLTADVYSNRDILGDDVIAGFESDYPEGHPKRRTLIHGLRGVNVVGKPVYDGYFSLSQVKPVAFSPDLELFEGWDFGHSYPAVVWVQYAAHEDRLSVLGAVQGRDMFLEDFAPEVQAIREEWFPFALTRSWCDPSGETGNQGIKQTALLTLRDHDVPALPAEKANDPVVRDKAIQTLSALMWRRRFTINPRCVELTRSNNRIERRETRLVVSALSVGYVWDERKNLRANPNIRSPRKGTRYDHTMNCLEYIVVGARVPAKPKSKELARAAAQHVPAIQRVHQETVKAEQRLLRRSQQDRDPADRRGGTGFIRYRRGGY